MEIDEYLCSLRILVFIFTDDGFYEMIKSGDDPEHRTHQR